MQSVLKKVLLCLALVIALTAFASCASVDRYNNTISAINNTCTNLPEDIVQCIPFSYNGGWCSIAIVYNGIDGNNHVVANCNHQILFDLLFRPNEEYIASLPGGKTLRVTTNDVRVDTYTINP